MPHSDAASPILARIVDSATGNSFLFAEIGERGSEPAMTPIIKENVYSRTLIPIIHIKTIRTFPSNRIFRRWDNRILIILKQTQGFFNGTFQLRVMPFNHFLRRLHDVDIRLHTFAFHIPFAIQIVETASGCDKVTAINKWGCIPGANKAAPCSGANKRTYLHFSKEKRKQVAT